MRSAFSTASQYLAITGIDQRSLDLSPVPTSVPSQVQQRKYQFAVTLTNRLRIWKGLTDCIGIALFQGGIESLEVHNAHG